MKNIIFLIILLIPFFGYSQLIEYHKMPAICFIDKIEIAYEKAGVNTAAFYKAWENNETFNSIKTIEFKRKLEEDVVAFISKGYLYVISYEPNKDESQRYAFLYKKFVGDSNKNPWVKIDANPIFKYNNSDNASGAFSFCIKKEKDEKYNERIVKANNDNIIFILCDIEITFNGRTSYIKFPLILTSIIGNNNTLYYDWQNLPTVDLSHYPKKFKRDEFNESKLNNSLFTIKTINNNGKELSINMKSKTERTKDGFSETNISYTGDWGFCSFKESNFYIK